MTMTLSGDGTITGLAAGGLPNATVTADDLAAGAALNSVSDGVFFRNRIINGDMRIDQRNAGASVTVNSSAIVYTVDRFLSAGVTAEGVFTVQQDSSAPTGFVNSVKITTTTEDTSLTTTQLYLFQQRIEGFNVADFSWGTANAKTVTLSFWVRSSLTGTFGGSLRNGSLNRSYPYTYSIASADTWEYKTITIAGDTSGTWNTDNTAGVIVNWSMGSGPDRSGTAGSWAAANYTGATGATDVISTLNATWYITGVQLEVGSVATPFERRPYGTELALCQRYYWSQWSGNSTNSGTGRRFGVGNVYGGGGGGYIPVFFPTPMRAAPTATFETATNYMMINANDSGNPSCSSLSLVAACTTQATINATVSSGLVAGNCTALTGANSSIYPVIQYSAEL